MGTWIDKFINVNQFARSGKKLNAVKKLVIHYTANNGGTAMNHFNYFNNLKDRYASAHIFVDKLEALCIIPLNEVAYHAGDIQKRNGDGTPYRGVKELLPSANYLSIGVEMCVEKDGTFHPDTIARTEDVFVDLCKKYNLDPISDIVRHYDVTKKNCPAPWVSDGAKFIDFKNRVKAKLVGTFSSYSQPSSHPLLKNGSKGDAVKELQNLLNSKGYKLVADGDFGKNTDSVVRDYQSKNNLTVDGVVGDATWNSLTKVDPVQSVAKDSADGKLERGERGENVRQLNLWLKELEYTTKSDDLYDQYTEAAFKLFLKDQGLPEITVYTSAIGDLLIKAIEKKKVTANNKNLIALDEVPDKNPSKFRLGKFVDTDDSNLVEQYKKDGYKVIDLPKQN